MLSQKEEFTYWLDTQKKLKHSQRQIISIIEECSAYAVKHGVSQNSFFEITDEFAYTIACQKLMGMRFFRALHRKTALLFDKVYLYYKKYLTDLKKAEILNYIDSSKVELPVTESTLVTSTAMNEKGFVEWMRNSEVSNVTISSYLSAINQSSKAISEHEIGDANLINVTDVNMLIQLKNSLFEVPEFKKYNEQQHNRFNSALNKLIAFRTKEPGENILDPSWKVPAEKPEPIPQISIPQYGMTKTQVYNDPEIEGFDKILRDNFSEGLQPNPLRLDKFRMFYGDEFGTELAQDDDLLLSQLKKAGTFMDGRIYPKQDTEQSSLTADIINEIITTLNGGARCIYFSCVLERWRQELADQLNIYNEDTLKALLRAQKVQGLVLTDYVLKTTSQKVYLEENVVELMKESHMGINYEQIQEKLWFIPMDVIKNTLVTTPAIVNVDAETYFYAPNFPASATELHHLKGYMSAKIENKGYLVAHDIAEIIQKDCRTIAINTVGYKDWAYRNVLKYIFRDNFEFGGSIVSAKGRALEMWQVYRGFCKEHEYLTLEALKQFANEVGVSIYWDDVLSEMIRINKDELVRRDKIHFNVEATDKVLEEMCLGDYIPMKTIDLFLHFPATEYPWNSFVLESYLQISKKFKLYHSSYSNHGVFGIMVKRDSKLEDYKQVVVDMLANSNEWTTIKQALELIVDKGYQARKRWTGFEQITQEAGLIREKLQAERK